MSNWSKVRLGDILKQHRPAQVEPAPGDVVGLAGVRWYGDGLFIRENRQGSQLKGRVYGLRPGLLVYNRLFAWKQSFAIVPDEFREAVVSNEFPQFEIDPERVVPEFVALYCSSPIFAAKALARSSGAAAVSRNRLKEADFLNLSVDLPSLEEQKTIVELMASAQAATTAVNAELRTVERVRAELIAELFRRKDSGWRALPIRDIGTVTRGRRFVKADYVNDGIGCIHYAQIHTDFLSSTATPPAYLPVEMREKLRFAKPGSLVIAGTSENRDGVLKGIAWLGDQSIAVHDDAFILEHSLDPRFMAHAFSDPDFRHQVEHVLSDTKVVRVSRDNLLRLTIAVPPMDVQTQIADTVDAVDLEVVALRREAEAASATQSALLDGLLSRRVPFIA